MYMRKKIILLISLLVVSVTITFADDYYGTVILQHNNEDSFYEAKDIQKAFDMAVEGDTIHISNGYYPEVTMRSLVYVKNNRWWQTIIVDIPDKTVFDKPFLEGAAFRLRFKNNVELAIFENLYIQIPQYDNSITIKKIEFHGCYIEGFDYHISQIEADNCYVRSIWIETQSEEISKFTNCYLPIGTCRGKGFEFENCVFEFSCLGCDPVVFDNCKLTNCLFDSTKFTAAETTTVTNCWNVDNNSIYDYVQNVDKLKEAGYIGTDGTAIGYLGGSNPYKVTGATSGWGALLQNFNKKGRKMAPDYYIFD